MGKNIRGGEMKISRQWNMPSKDTFSISCIREFINRYYQRGGITIDPFARNSRYGTYTNDLNPDTKATYHMKAVDFLGKMVDDGVRADLVLFDPPYSLRQVKECYESYGDKEFTYQDTITAVIWKREKELCLELLKVGGYFLHFGWHSNGMGKKRNFRIVEIMLVAHGRAHNDTICMSEIKEAHQGAFQI
jgi:hypothetical protein